MKNSENDAVAYDHWYDQHPYWFQSEIKAIKKVFLPSSHSLEVGIGTGRFAEALNIPEGIEPNESMALLAKKRGIKVLKGHAENLPIADASLEVVIMVTVDCFFTDIKKAYEEVLCATTRRKFDHWYD